MKLYIFLFLAASAMLASCAGCSKSGNRPKGPKTFKVVKVLGTDIHSNGLQLFIVDTDGDGIADEELVNDTDKELKKNDSATVILQEGIVTGWYK